MRWLLIVGMLANSFFTLAVEVTWTGSGGMNWNNAANWSTGQVPSVSDDVVFISPATVDMDILSPATYAVRSLRISNNVTVTLRRQQAGGGARIFQVRSTDAMVKGLQIDAGSILIIHGINTAASGSLDYILDMGGAAGVTGEISGELHFTGAGSVSSDNGTRLRVYTDPANHASLRVKAGAAIRYYEFTGNTGSSAGNYLAMENGSVYELVKNGGSFPHAQWAANSLAKATGTGVNGPFFNSSEYGNLEWNCPLQSAITFLNKDIHFNNIHFISTNSTDVNGEFRIKTGSSTGVYTLYINGNLTLSPGARLVTTSANTPLGSNGGIIAVKGNIVNSGTITTYGVTGTISNLVINGSTAQTFSGTGDFSGASMLFTMMNPSGLTLLSPLILPGNLHLVDGRMITSPANILALRDNALCTGAHPGSFVDGPMRKTGDEGFLFPVGEGNEFAPIGISSSADPADVFVARYTRGNPRVSFGPDFESPPIHHMSVLEWWTLAREAGTSPRSVTLYARTLSEATLLSDLAVLRWDGAIWRNEGNSAYTGIAAGPVTSEFVDEFEEAGFPTAFTFGSRTGHTNPLPLTFLSFDAHLEAGGRVRLEWETAEQCDSSIRFEVQKEAGNNFVSIGSIQGNGERRYSFIVWLAPGFNYVYRILSKNVAGEEAISPAVAVSTSSGEQKPGILLSSSTTPGEFAVSISPTLQDVELICVDVLGRTILRQPVPNHASGVMRISLRRFAAGVYLIYGVAANGRTNVVRLLNP